MKQIAHYAGAVTAIAAAWLWSQPVQACKCMLLEPAAAAEQASAVFEGRVVEVSDVPNTPMPRRQVTLRIVRVWKGMQAEQAVLTTASESAACGIEFARDQNYLVYASLQDGALSANSCSRTRPIADAAEDVSALGMGWTPVDPKAGANASDKPADKPGDKPASKPAEPPARGGCASCSLANKRTTPGALALLLPAFWLIRRRAGR